MYKVAAITLSSVLGVAGAAASMPAEAHPYFTVGIGVPGLVVEPIGYGPRYDAPYYYARAPEGRYCHRDFEHDRYHHFQRHFDHDDRRWDRDDRHWDRR